MRSFVDQRLDIRLLGRHQVAPHFSTVLRKTPGGRHCVARRSGPLRYVIPVKVTCRRDPSNVKASPTPEYLNFYLINLTYTHHRSPSCFSEMSASSTPNVFY